MIIEYKGQVLNTIHYSPLTEEHCEEIRKAYYVKPPFEEVEKNIISVEKGGSMITKINNYYFKDLVAKVKMSHSKWSIEEVFECDDLIRFFYNKTIDNKKIYPDTDSDIKKIETCLRLGGKGVASKPSNFPLKSANDILEQYNLNNNYYDFSCGWGVRLLSALKNNINYFGTDPNFLLTERLIQLKMDYKRITNKNTSVDIRTQGSEIFVPEWEGKMGVAFSSPPYFALEDYRIGKQSYKEGVTYSDWKNGYYLSTIENIHKYLIEDGKLIININNYDKITLVEDTIKICEYVGFKLIATHVLKNIKRTKSTGGFNDNGEDIMVFQKI